MPEKIFIAGATARSASQSAVRAGMEVAAADLFGDRDLRACCVFHRVHDYPDDVFAIAGRVSRRKWVYTGGFENQPELVRIVSERHDLLGNPPSVLRRVRDPWRLRDALINARLPAPEIRDRPPHGFASEWLCKPMASCGGANVRSWSDATPETESSMVDSRYFQRRVRGAVYGAVYVAGLKDARFLGVTRQLQGCRWAGARGLLYVGSIGPVAVEPGVAAQFQRIGQCLTAAFGLRGLFGVDAILENGHVWTIEVNPRFTASVEIHERATGFCAMEEHRWACENTGWNPTVPPKSNLLHGKAVVYAPIAGTVSDQLCRQIDVQNERGPFPNYADLPLPGSMIGAGHPLLTVFAHGSRATDVYRSLRERALCIQNRFRNPANRTVCFLSGDVPSTKRRETPRFDPFT